MPGSLLLMDRITLKSLLEHFAAYDAPLVAKALKTDGVHGGVLTRQGDGYSCIVFGPAAQCKTVEKAWHVAEDPLGYYLNRAVNRPLERAIAWLEEHPQASMRDAAREFGIDVAAISRGLKKLRCPCCGQPIRTLRP